MYEVEQKFQVDDLGQIRTRLLDRFGGTIQAKVWQSDQYLAHPSRDFSVTDEALRIRHTKIDGGDEQIRLTYKGPRLDCDGGGSAFKTRKEIEMLISRDPDSADQLQSIFESIGFLPLPVVIKTRLRIVTTIMDWSIEFALDQVQDLGAFLEIEAVAGEQQIKSAQTVLAQISDALGLSDSLICSYLDMLLKSAANRTA